MYAGATETRSPPITVPMLRQFKQDGRKIVAITAYDASFARLADDADIDVILIGDSLGMVVHGKRSTLSVTVDDIIYHARSVARGSKRALRIADMPYATYPDPKTAFAHAARMIGEGECAMVKLEGGGPVIESIRYLVDREVPVCAHLGLTPQSVLRLGGYKVQGRGDAAAQALRDAARAAQVAGAEMLVLECVPSPLAAAIQADLAIPVIGIGAGAQCDGQILVCYDVIGISSGRRPRFVKNFLLGRDSVLDAFKAYVADARSASFPDAAHEYAD
ncbi:MAG: 3-methyl-2-oxobutanoate hydroxymethyltransferase [Rhodanobacteraceae bacterium]|nr:3-methyl-2-oxobutanoate hydroxymethyltransferase [Rhodanobacteraceae bacterium]MBK7044434.1 3-methyl-2-oxobutanoate hydroxymethyltransferase [Rhodanobacteraceae bacterium]MBP9154501.1 3-methyl-2-oxobutanoate hydroxymethyltransferase [Xanthomonadales bacterium]HQW80589.1 3-methyl-2-oxobutanoate hydroxymethyltransferase [Pseudomonadota bacterium]